MQHMLIDILDVTVFIHLKGQFTLKKKHILSLTPGGV